MHSTIPLSHSWISRVRIRYMRKIWPRALCGNRIISLWTVKRETQHALWWWDGFVIILIVIDKSRAFRSSILFISSFIPVRFLLKGFIWAETNEKKKNAVMCKMVCFWNKSWCQRPVAQVLMSAAWCEQRKPLKFAFYGAKFFFCFVAQHQSRPKWTLHFDSIASIHSTAHLNAIL